MSDPLEKTYELGRLQGIKDCEAMHHRIRADERAKVLREVAKMLRDDATNIRRDLPAKLREIAPGTAVFHREAVQVMNDAIAGALEGWAEQIAAAPAQGARNEE